MATKAQEKTNTAAQGQQQSAYLAYLQEQDHAERRRPITKFATAIFNNGKNIRRMGMEITVQNTNLCGWAAPINEANAKKFGYKMGKVTRKDRNGSKTEDVIYFPEFHMHLVAVSDKFIECTKKDTEVQGVMLQSYDRVGVFRNADDTKGNDYDFYNQLRDEHPNCFSSRQFFMIMLVSKDGERLHTKPILLSLKGGALAKFSEAINDVCGRLGMIESQVMDRSDASPLDFDAVSPYRLHVVCKEDTVGNGEKSADVTGVESIGANLTAESLVADNSKLFNTSIIGEIDSWREANREFTAIYDQQIGNVLGRQLRNALSPNDVAPPVLPGTIETEVVPITQDGDLAQVS